MLMVFRWTRATWSRYLGCTSLDLCGILWSMTSSHSGLRNLWLRCLSCARISCTSFLREVYWLLLEGILISDTCLVLWWLIRLFPYWLLQSILNREIIRLCSRRCFAEIRLLHLSRVIWSLNPLSLNKLPGVLLDSIRCCSGALGLIHRRRCLHLHAGLGSLSNTHAILVGSALPIRSGRIYRTGSQLIPEKALIERVVAHLLDD